MKKILLLINNGFPHHAMDFIVEIFKKEKCKVNVLFIESLKRDDRDAYLFPSDINATETDFTVETDEQEILRDEADEMRLFNDVCKINNIDGYIQVIRENYLDKIVDETAFADLVICDDNMDLSVFSMNSFISSSHCPVILVPKEAVFFSNVIFTYDGHISSINAIKQFAYLLPWTRSLQVFLVSVLPPNIILMEYDALVREWITLHYANAEVVILKGEVKTEMANFINKQENSIVVMGAFGRSALSRLFKESLAPNILKSTLAPLFISHN